MTPPFKVLAMHDLCGYGRSSLSAVSTILPSLNCQVCPLPTALLAHHFGFSVLPSVLNLGDELKKFIPLWQELNLKFDAFYSGYLASPDQVAIAESYIDSFKPGFIFVDPVLGDNGALYHGFDDNQVSAMKKLIGRAAAASPNLTEAAFLLGREVKLAVTEEEAKEMLLALHKLGVKQIVLTGSHHAGDNHITSYAYDSGTGQFFRVSTPYINFEHSLHGTGDSFASILVGRLLQGLTFERAVKQAASYLYKCAKLAKEYNLELCLEPALPSLMQGDEECDFKVI
ncbi:MAG: pyridoxamine kinase [Spirochaetaceae bacterium]|nr:pyridoxamine kinase [Spirochaetaceae bacterium]